MANNGVSPVLPTRHPHDACGLEVPPVRLSTVGKRTFPVSGATVWNDQPLHVASAPSLAFFRQRLTTFLSSRSYQDAIIRLVCYYHHSSHTVWSPVVLAVINIIYAMLKMFMMMMMMGRMTRERSVGLISQLTWGRNQLDAPVYCTSVFFFVADGNTR